MSNLIKILTSIVSKILAHIWWRLPISREQKEDVKTFIFSNFYIFFRYTSVYRNWESARFLSIIEVGKSNNNIIEFHRFQLKELYENTPISADPIHSIAIVIHVFYLEILDELLSKINISNNIMLKFYITSPIELSDAIQHRFEILALKYVYVPVENRGRDILPFLKILPIVFKDGFQIVLKIHTKKSLHLKTGFIWRNDMYKKLLSEKAMKSILNLFNAVPEIGMLGPEGHIVPMNLYYGANSDRLKAICIAFKIPIQHLFEMNFVAGSMFYARIESFFPLLNLDLQVDDFEPELGQLDGTMAHVIERSFAISTYVSGLKLVDSAYHPLEREIKTNLNYKFTR
ncbi:MAG: rhamnan synthesis F family protein [Bacteroidales bacterium]